MRLLSFPLILAGILAIGMGLIQSYYLNIFPQDDWRIVIMVCSHIGGFISIFLGLWILILASSK